MKIRWHFYVILLMVILAIFLLWRLLANEATSRPLCLNPNMNPCPFLYVCGGNGFIPSCTFAPLTWILIYLHDITILQIISYSILFCVFALIFWSIFFRHRESSPVPQPVPSSSSPYHRSTLTLLIVGSIACFLAVITIIRYLQTYQVYPARNPTQPTGTSLRAPKEGWNAEDKEKLKNILDQITYLQPDYLPPGFHKEYDLPDNTGSIETVYRSSSVTDPYATLLFHQYTKQHVWKSHHDIVEFIKKLQEKNSRYSSLEIQVRDIPAIYVEQPAYLIDPYFDPNFRTSLTGQKYLTGTDKYLYWFENTTLKELKISFVFDFSPQQAQTELIHMAESMNVGKTDTVLNITTTDQEKIMNEHLRGTAAALHNTVMEYRMQVGQYPWEGQNSCFGRGNFPDFTPVGSVAFQTCLQRINQSTKTPFTDNEILRRLYIYQNAHQNFHQASNANENIEVYEGYSDVRICYPATVLSDYVQSYLTSKPRTFVDDYPMFNNQGQVDLTCKDDPIKNSCYYCTESQP